MANKDIRDLIKKKRLLHYEVASTIGVSEYTLCRWLRTEMPDDKKELVMSAINKLVSQMYEKR